MFRLALVGFAYALIGLCEAYFYDFYYYAVCAVSYCLISVLSAKLAEYQESWLVSTYSVVNFLCAIINTLVVLTLSTELFITYLYFDAPFNFGHIVSFIEFLLVVTGGAGVLAYCINVYYLLNTDPHKHHSGYFKGF